MIPRLLSLPLLAALLVVPATAHAVDYPEPAKPKGATGAPKGPFRTLRVCKSTCRHKTIQSAVDAAHAGDTIRVARGTYREGVKVFGARKRHLKIIGNADTPESVVIQAPARGAQAQNGIFINGADKVTVRGFRATGQKGNGFFATNVDGYTFDRLIAAKTGVYGIYAFNSKGGSITNSLAYYNRDGGYYIGQTPPQTRPKRTIVRNVVSWGNVLGFSASHMRYTTITGSRFFNNAVGIAPNAIDSEKYPPAESNVIVDNDIFWNNFDAYRAAPFDAKANEDFVYPPGTGVILLSGRENVVEGNRFWGHQLGAFIEVQNIFLKAKSAIDLRGNVVRGNRFGLDGLDKNGRDLIYTGNGTGNCFEGNLGVETTVPNDPAAFPACPGPDNQDSEPAVALLFDAAVNKKYRENWIETQRTPIQGIEPLVDYRPGVTYGPTTLDPAPAARAAGAQQRRTVSVGDFYLTPRRITVSPGTRIVWRWLGDNTDMHDVTLAQGPRGVRRWQSETAATGYSYRRTLRKPGRYTVVCSLHPDTMVQRIRVSR